MVSAMTTLPTVSATANPQPSFNLQFLTIICGIAVPPITAIVIPAIGAAAGIAVSIAILSKGTCSQDKKVSAQN